MMTCDLLVVVKRWTSRWLVILLQLNVECELICVFLRNYSVLMLKYKCNHTVEFGNLSTNMCM